MAILIDEARTGAQTANETESVAASGTLSFTVDTVDADRLVVLVDDGSGAQAASYDLQYDTYSPQFDAYQIYKSVAGATPPHEEVASPGQMQVTLTNSSGASANYRVRVVSLEGEVDS